MKNEVRVGSLKLRAPVSALCGTNGGSLSGVNVKAVGGIVEVVFAVLQADFGYKHSGTQLFPDGSTSDWRLDTSAGVGGAIQGTAAAKGLKILGRPFCNGYFYARVMHGTSDTCRMIQIQFPATTLELSEERKQEMLLQCSPAIAEIVLASLNNRNPRFSEEWRRILGVVEAGASGEAPPEADFTKRVATLSRDRDSLGLVILSLASGTAFSAYLPLSAESLVDNITELYDFPVGSGYAKQVIEAMVRAEMLVLHEATGFYWIPEALLAEYGIGASDNEGSPDEFLSLMASGTAFVSAAQEYAGDVSRLEQARIHFALTQDAIAQNAREQDELRAKLLQLEAVATDLNRTDAEYREQVLKLGANLSRPAYRRAAELLTAARK